MTDAYEQIGITVLPNGYVSRDDAAKLLGRKRQTLAHWATAGVGPAYVNVMGKVFYKLADIEAMFG